MSSGRHRGLPSMAFTDVLTVLMVADFGSAAPWYERLFGRPPDRRPMANCAEWQVTAGGSVQVYQDPGHAGGTTVVVGVDDVDAHVRECAERGLAFTVADTPSGQFRLATVEDPAGNTVMLSQSLG
jgi:predicted enzyme related to lactoylglutathione lyase